MKSHPLFSLSAFIGSRTIRALTDAEKASGRLAVGQVFSNNVWYAPVKTTQVAGNPAWTNYWWMQQIAWKYGETNLTTRASLALKLDTAKKAALTGNDTVTATKIDSDAWQSLMLWADAGLTVDWTTPPPATTNLVTTTMQPAP